MSQLAPILRRPGTIALAVFILLTGVLWLLWIIADGKVRDGFADWTEARRADGWQIAHGDIDTGGFPFAVRLHLKTPRLLIPTDPNRSIVGLVGLAADAESADVVWSLFDPFAVRLELPARTALEARWPNGGLWQGALAGGGQVTVSERSGGFKLSLVLDNAALTATGKGSDMRADRLALDIVRHPKQSTDHLRPSLDLEFDLVNLLAPDADPILAKPLSVGIRATVMGALPPGPPAVVLPAWRDEGGTIEMHELRAASGTVKLLGNATLALDRQMRPQAAGTLTAIGFPEAIERLTEAGLIEERDAKLSKLLLLALAKKDQETGLPSLSIPVTVQNGWFSAGPSQLFQVKPIRP
ncbi:DUF2125 domain-containing protein [Lacibacterium aquatile]|uniref:DUF2125 domain-containing protein n=1 Tax=Lacibacterium aquatile TaxID=1168082 RepID=A0ABW5DW29_9PROT